MDRPVGYPLTKRNKDPQILQQDRQLRDKYKRAIIDFHDVDHLYLSAKVIIINVDDTTFSKVTKSRSRTSH